MPTWQHRETLEIGPFTVKVEERTDARTRHGAAEYIITVFDGEHAVHSERHPWNVWLGHCYGRFLIPEVVERAKRITHSGQIGA